MACTSVKCVPHLNAAHRLFVDGFVSQMERKLKENFERKGN